MFGIRPRCPVVEREQHWIESSMDWFRGQFGDAAIRRPVILPTDDYFPGTYTGTDAEVHAVVRRVSGYMGVDPDLVEVRFYRESAPDIAGVGQPKEPGTAGHYVVRDGRPVIGIEDAMAARPTALVATIAHELGHHLLLGANRIEPERKDGEPLTDLLTVYFGLGIFAANAALDFSRTYRPTRERLTLSHAQAVPAVVRPGWRASRLGYLTEPMFGYALARYAWLRGEEHPTWMSYVDVNPRGAMRKGLRYLNRSSTED
jgi:hypothetical protein